MDGLILHCGSHAASFDEVRAVPEPPYTETHRPPSYADILDHLHERVDTLGLVVKAQGYGLNRNDNQMFGVLSIDADNDQAGISIGIRQSLDKSLSLGIAIGAHVFVCDNLAFSGDSLKVIRRNTKYVWGDYVAMLDEQLSTMTDYFDRLRRRLSALTARPVSTTGGYQLLGEMQGEQVLTAQQASVAFSEWREPSHEEFKERNAYSLYSAVTEALKRGTPGDLLSRHVAAHDFFDARFES